MKPHPTALRIRSATGVTLIECLVYISVVAVVLGIGSMAFWQCWDAYKGLHRNADDIVRAVHAGEQWRADIRTATGPVRPENADGRQRLRIPGPGGEIVYTWTSGEVRRQAGPGAPGALLLTKVKSSRMQLNPRGHLTAWRWELELQPDRKKARLRPLFSFEAVPGSTLVP
ncbi:MAG: hypothetical protein ACYDH9_20775 [Limisphaerales bacterium]